MRIVNTINASSGFCRGQNFGYDGDQGEPNKEISLSEVHQYISKCDQSYFRRSSELEQGVSYVYWKTSVPH